MSRPLPLLLILALFVATFAACGGNGGRVTQSYYCLPGYTLQQGECVPESQPDADRPDGDSVDGDSVNGDTPDGDTPDGDTPDGDAPDGDTPDGDTPDGDAPDGDAPDGDAPDGDAPDGDAPDGDMPDGDMPDGDTEPLETLILHAPAALALGKTSGVVALLDPGAGALPWDVTEAVQWTSAAPLVLEVLDDPPRLRALALGDAQLTALHVETGAQAQVTVAVRPRNQVEARGIWVNRWAWTTAADIDAIIAKSAGAGFNQVYFQVRGIFDAYYQSAHEPWARRLSGTLGNNPGWDPLQTAISAARRHGVELHAWINVFTCWEGSSAPTESTPRHALLEHPEWIMQNASHVPMPIGSGYVWCSPGNPALRARNVAVVRDILGSYAVDGIHLDRVRYPSTDYSYDPVSEAAFQQERIARPSLSFSDWRREQVTAQVAGIYDAIRSDAPHVVLTAAVGGIYRDTFGWGGVTEAYVHWLQDWVAWDELGVIDAVIPMVYWKIRNDYAAWTDFKALTDSHATRITNRFLFIGSDMHATGDAERMASGKTVYEPYSQVEGQIAHTRLADTDGWVLYDYSTLQIVNYWETLAAGPFAQPATVPFMWWKHRP